jgi:polyisoprenoid-binding protein YceI
VSHRTSLGSRVAGVAAVFATGLAAAFFVASGAWGAVGDSEDALRFIAHQADVPLNGHFRDFKADVSLDPAHPQSGSVRVTIDLASIATAGGADADNMLRSHDFFDVAHFPTATFASSQIAAIGPGKFQANGTLTLKGQSHPLVLNFEAQTDPGGTWYRGKAPLLRLAYGVGLGEWSDTSTLDDEVQLDFAVHVKS